MKEGAYVGIKKVRVEGLVLLKIIRHCQEESSLDSEFLSGTLIGLGVDDTLEVTNCFATPRVTDENTASNETLNAYETEMIKNFRQINGDYLTVGFYQSTVGGSFITRNLIEGMFSYQDHMPESILLIYDPSLTARGHCGLTAYRLTYEVLVAMADADHKMNLQINKNVDISWECDAATTIGISNFTRLMEEIPVEVHNSPLVSIMLHDIVDRKEKILSRQSIPSLAFSSTGIVDDVISENSSSNVDLNTAANLESQLKSLLSSLDIVHDSQYNYQRKQMSLPKSTPQDVRNRDLAPIRMDISLISAQLNRYCTNISQMAGQTVGKLMLTEAIHPTGNEKKFGPRM